MLAAVEKAEQFAGDTHPEIAFNLGSTYASHGAAAEGKGAAAAELVHRSAPAAARRPTKYKEQCETTSSLIQKLGQ